MSNGYEALQSGAALLELSGRGRIEATGEDRARLLHALTTNHIQQLKPGEGAYAFFLTAQGRILADVHVLCFEDKLLLDLEPETREAIYRHIDHYIIADDVTLEDVTERTCALGVEGPEAGRLLEGLGVALPHAPESHVGWEDFTVARIAVTGEGFRVYGAAGRHDALRDRMVQAGAVRASAEEARAVRIERGIPRYGEDITASTLPQETGIARALHFSKGCYLGQEIVERIRSRGHVNKVLTALEIDTAEPLPSGTKITAGGAEAGEIASSVYSPRLSKVAAIAMLRVQLLQPGAEFEAGATKARVRVRQ